MVQNPWRDRCRPRASVIIRVISTYMMIQVGNANVLEVYTGTYFKSMTLSMKAEIQQILMVLSLEAGALGDNGPWLMRCARIQRIQWSKRWR